MKREVPVALIEYVIRILPPARIVSNQEMDRALEVVTATLEHRRSDGRMRVEALIDHHFISDIDGLGSAGFTVEILRKEEELVPETPRYPHHCVGCIFLSHQEKWDLYFCQQNGTLPTVIARKSDEGPDYVSGLASANHIPELMEARRRARLRGLLQ